MRVLPAFAAGVAAVALATSASAAVVFVSGTSQTINFNGMENGTPISGLSGQITYTLTGFTNGGKTANFNFSVTDTAGGATTGSRISTFGFNVTPDITGASITGGTVFTGASNGNVPSLGSFEFCATAGPNCAGGGGGGAAEGAGPVTGSFALTFASALSSVTFDQEYVRYQSVNNAQAGLEGGSAVGLPTTGGVPEPTSWAMMILGVFGVGAVLRRQRQAKAALV
jgi:hypothetical protein